MPLVAVLQGGRERMERGEGEVQYMGDIIKDITAMEQGDMVTVLLGGESNEHRVSSWLPSSTAPEAITCGRAEHLHGCSILFDQTTIFLLPSPGLQWQYHVSGKKYSAATNMNSTFS